MDRQALLLKYPELKELLHLFRYEIQQTQRPADEVILDDEDVMRKLKISRRRLQYLKSEGKIPVRKFDPDSPRCYYLLSDILAILNENCTEAIKPRL